MKRPRPGVGAELLPIALILIGLAGAFALVVAMHRQAALDRASSRAQAVASALPPPTPEPEPVAPPAPAPVVVADPPPILEDPTKIALARIAAEVADNRQVIRASDRRAAALDRARRDAVARATQWRRREALVKAQVDELDKKARVLEGQADLLAADRDVLALERDAERAALVAATAKGGSYAVLPHRGANGTWQRPVVIECRDGTATLQPKGLTFSLVDMSAGFGPRSSPLVAAVARELIAIYRGGGVGGDSVVPYIYFLVRPDGIRPYYEARARLEPLGIAFGYELVDQSMDIDFPDFDNLTAWDGSGVPKVKDRAQAPLPGGAGGGDFVWPADRPGSGSPDQNGGATAGRAQDGGLWPTRPASVGVGAGIDEVGTPGRGTIGRQRADGLGRVDSDGPGGAEVGPTSDANGLVPVNPGLLPGFDRLSDAAAASRAASAGRGTQPLGDRTPLPPLPEGSLTPPGVGAGAGGGARSRLSNTRSAIASLGPYLADSQPVPPGRIRIDPEQIAQDDDPFEEAERLKRAGAGRGSSTPSGGAARNGTGESSGGARSSAGTASAEPGSGSTSGEQSGTIGLGMPSLGSSAGERSGDVRPQRANPPAWTPKQETKVDAPLELVVACGPDGVIIHPGGYRLSASALRKPGSLMKDLETIVHNHAMIDPSVRPIPRLQFLIERAGSETYQEARRQSILSGLPWPVTLRVAGPPALGVFTKERF